MRYLTKSLYLLRMHPGPLAHQWPIGLAGGLAGVLRYLCTTVLASLFLPSFIVLVNPHIQFL